MVRFKEEGYVIEVRTNGNPAEDYLDVVTGLYGIIRNMPQDEPVPDQFHSVIDFLQNMLPEWKDVKKMVR